MKVRKITGKNQPGCQEYIFNPLMWSYFQQQVLQLAIKCNLTAGICSRLLL